MKNLLLLALFVPLLASACDLTEEYKEARIEIFKNSRYGYDACMNSVNSVYYWKEVAKCEEAGGSEVGGGCQHVAGGRYYEVPEAEKEHCKVLKVSWVEVAKYLEEYVKEMSIRKCI